MANWHGSSTVVQLTLIFFLSTCHAYEIPSDRILPTTEGRTCTPLEKPEHGWFKCNDTKNGRMCVLVCDDDYVVPLTYPPVKDDVSRRGIYLCEKLPGGMSWRPNRRFDCVERVLPENIIFHYSFNVTESCSNETEAKEQWLDTFLTGKTMSTSCETCSIEMFLKCTSYNTLIEIFLYMPFTHKLQDNFRTIRSEISSKMSEDRRNLFNRAGQLYASGGFTSDCPRGTLLQQDFTCRGCSKGYYMDLGNLVCKECPSGTYQEENLQPTCKRCPGLGRRKVSGLKSRLHCYFSSDFLEQTFVTDLLTAMTCVVIVSTVLLYFRGFVTNEPDADTIEQERYMLDDKDDGNQVMVEKGGGDIVVKSTRPTPSFNTADAEEMRKSLIFRTLPLEARPSTKDEKKLVAESRMLQSMQAAVMRRKAVAVGLISPQRIQELEGLRNKYEEDDLRPLGGYSLSGEARKSVFQSMAARTNRVPSMRSRSSVFFKPAGRGAPLAGQARRSISPNVKVSRGTPPTIQVSSPTFKIGQYSSSSSSSTSSSSTTYFTTTSTSGTYAQSTSTFNRSNDKTKGHVTFKPTKNN